MGKKEKQPFKMDELKGDHGIYKEVFDESAGIMSLILGLYLLLGSQGVDLASMFVELVVGWLPLPGNIIQLVLEVALEIFGFLYSSAKIFDWRLSCKQQAWAEENKKMMLQGQWLHIHEKENIRIGIVEIKQNFSTVEVSGFNINPLAPGVNDTGCTTWSYIDSELYPADMTGVKFFGSYAARKSNGTINQGVHVFNELTPDANGIPDYLCGSFCDCFDLNKGQPLDINDRKGIIYLYRMTPGMKEYLDKNSLGNYNLCHILENADKEEHKNISAEPYVLKLHEVIHRYYQKKQEQEAELQDRKDLQTLFRSELTSAQSAALNAAVRNKLSAADQKLMRHLFGM